MNAGEDKIVVIDFGGQYAHLISRRIRELGVKAVVVPYSDVEASDEIRGAKGFILSGGPASVYGDGSPRIDLKKLGEKPILGICYGLQLIAHQLGGRVEKATQREYGRTPIQIVNDSPLFQNLPTSFEVWMSHSDKISALPPSFRQVAQTEYSQYAAIQDENARIFGVQFHPEVSHTQHGKEILGNFIFHICGCGKSWSIEDYAEKVVSDISREVGDGRVLCALSGGVDSTVTAVLVKKAVGDRLTCVFVNHGLLRKGEAEQVLKIYRDQLKLPNLKYVDASERFLSKLKGVKDPEEKRKIIGREFTAVFEEINSQYGPFDYLAQGTLYPDVIESGVSRASASRIKSHHNVGGLPPNLRFKLIEPLRELYKDEVRQLATILGVPDRIAKRHPFPGPGLAVRIIGEVTEEKLRICREASSIVEEELEREGLLDKIWQAFAVVGDDMATGVKGDERSYGHIVIVRAVVSEDAMTADWARLPHSLLDRISRRITNEVEGVTWVAYAISSKPPSTIEPQ